MLRRLVGYRDYMQDAGEQDTQWSMYIWFESIFDI